MNRKTNALHVNDGRPSVMFIHSVIDDYGLDVYAFRVYARLARRAGTNNSAYESVANMADACGMSERRLQEALQTLVDHGLVTREERRGKTTLYTLTPVDSWTEQVINTPAQNVGGAPGAEVPPQEMHPTPAGGAPEVNPIKGNPIKGKNISSVAPTSTCFEYLETWNNHCGMLPRANKLTTYRRKKITHHIKEHGADALETFQQAVQAVANEDFWIERSYGIDNLLRDKITTYAEKHQATKTKHRPAILNINPEDLF